MNALHRQLLTLAAHLLCVVFLAGCSGERLGVQGPATWVFVDLDTSPPKPYMPSGLQWRPEVLAFIDKHHLKLSSLAASKSRITFAAESIDGRSLTVFRDDLSLLGNIPANPELDWHITDAGVVFDAHAPIPTDPKRDWGVRGAGVVFDAHLKYGANRYVWERKCEAAVPSAVTQVRPPFDGTTESTTLRIGVLMAIGDSHCLIYAESSFWLHDLRSGSAARLTGIPQADLHLGYPLCCAFDDDDAELLFQFHEDRGYRLFAYRDASSHREIPVPGYSGEMVALSHGVVTIHGDYGPTSAGYPGAPTSNEGALRHIDIRNPGSPGTISPYVLPSAVSPDTRIVAWSVSYGGTYIAEYSDAGWQKQLERDRKGFYKHTFLPRTLFRER